MLMGLGGGGFGPALSCCAWDGASRWSKADLLHDGLTGRSQAGTAIQGSGVTEQGGHEGDLGEGGWQGESVPPMELILGNFYF